MSVDLHQDLVGHVFHLGWSDVLLDSVDQVLDTELFCQGEKMGEILLGVDTIQAEVVIVDEVDEEVSCTNSDTGKIDDDIFNGLEKIQIEYNFSRTTFDSIIVPLLLVHRTAERKPR